MSIDSDREARTFGNAWGLWPDLTNHNRAIRAARKVQYIAFLFAIFSSVHIFIGIYGAQPMTLLNGGKTIEIAAFDYYWGLFLLKKFEILWALLLFWFGWRIRNGRLGVVPIIVGYFCFETFFKLVQFFEVGLILSIILLPWAINGLRGWWEAQKFKAAGATAPQQD